MKMQYDAVSKRLRDGFEFVGHFKCDEMSSSTAFTVRTLLIFLQYIFEFFINKALPPSNSVVYRQNFKGKNVKDTHLCNIWCRGAIDIAMT